MTEEKVAEVLADVEEAERGHGSAGVDRFAVVLATADVRMLIDERKALLAALKKIQWSGHSGYGHGDPGFNLCPECKGAAPDSGWPSAGRHDVGCSVGGAIKKAEAP